MGSKPKAPPAPPDPNVVAEKNRQKGVALAQVYAQQTSAFGSSSTESGSAGFALDPSMFALDPGAAVDQALPAIKQWTGKPKSTLVPGRAWNAPLEDGRTQFEQTMDDERKQFLANVNFVLANRKKVV